MMMVVRGNMRECLYTYWYADLFSWFKNIHIEVNICYDWTAVSGVMVAATKPMNFFFSFPQLNWANFGFLEVNPDREQQGHI